MGIGHSKTEFWKSMSSIFSFFSGIVTDFWIKFWIECNINSVFSINFAAFCAQSWHRLTNVKNQPNSQFDQRLYTHLRFVQAWYVGSADSILSTHIGFNFPLMVDGPHNSITPKKLGKYFKKSNKLESLFRIFVLFQINIVS